MLPALEQEVSLRDKEGEKGEWTLYVDCSSNVRGAVAGIVLTSPAGESVSLKGREIQLQGDKQ